MKVRLLPPHIGRRPGNVFLDDYFGKEWLLILESDILDL
jgi:hypothetical protein